MSHIYLDICYHFCLPGNVLTKNTCRDKSNYFLDKSIGLKMPENWRKYQVRAVLSLHSTDQILVSVFIRSLFLCYSITRVLNVCLMQTDKRAETIVQCSVHHISYMTVLFVSDSELHFSLSLQ